MAMDLYIDPRLQKLLPPLTTEEREQLERNLIADGRVIDPILYWFDGERNVVVDGMHRAPLARKHGLPFRSEPLVFESIEQVEIWILDHVAGRRHFADKLSLRKQRGELYNRLKQPRGGDHGAKDQNDPLVQTRAQKATSDPPEAPPRKSTPKDQNDPLVGSTAEKLAEKHGVSPASIKRDAKLVQSIEKLAPTIRAKYESGDLRLPDSIIHCLASVDPTTQLTIQRDVRVSGMKWAEACAQRGAELPHEATRKPPREKPARAKPEPKSAPVETAPEPPQLLNEARKLFDRMTPEQRRQTHVLWGEWLEDSQEAKEESAPQTKTVEPVAEAPAEPSKKNGHARSRFTPPSVEEVGEYCEKRENGIDAQEFIDFYSARGWKLTKGVGMTDWQAAVRTWEKNRRLSGANGNGAVVPRRTATNASAARAFLGKM